jgi:Holliday junction resolvase RusA-like endonuclease
MTAGEPVTFAVAGEPCGKGRARSVIRKSKTRGSFIGNYTPEKTRSYEGMIRHEATVAMDGRAPFAEPVHVEMRAIFSVPASWSKRKQAAALTNELRPGKRPDLDNIAKAVTDAINTVVVADDALIVSGNFAKVYGPAPMVVVTVRPAPRQFVR